MSGYKPSDTRLEVITRRVKLRFITQLMTDRYAGDNKTVLQWNQKIYLHPTRGCLALPVSNIVSFLTAQNTNSAPKRLLDKRTYRQTANAIASFCTVAATDGGDYIPLCRDGKEIVVGRFEDDRDPVSGLWLHRSVARLKDGIPNPKERPVLPLPIELEFDLNIFPNKEIKEQQIFNLLRDGGMAIGLGTFRGQYGKFVVDSWE